MASAATGPSRLPLITSLCSLWKLLALKDGDTLGFMQHISWAHSRSLAEGWLEGIAGQKSGSAQPSGPDSSTHRGGWPPAPAPGRSLLSLAVGPAGVREEQATRLLLWALRNEPLMQHGRPDNSCLYAGMSRPDTAPPHASPCSAGVPRAGQGMNREGAPGKSPEEMYIQQKVRVLLMLRKMGSNVSAFGVSSSRSPREGA